MKKTEIASITIKRVIFFLLRGTRAIKKVGNGWCILFYKILHKDLHMYRQETYYNIKLRCDTRFQHAFPECSCVFKVITLVWSNQRNFFENAITCSKRTLKTTVATHLNLWYIYGNDVVNSRFFQNKMAYKVIDISE